MHLGTVERPCFGDPRHLPQVQATLEPCRATGQLDRID
jgi:hypothetical protein